MRSLPEACAQYDAQRKLWTISFEIYERLVSVLNSSQYAQCVTVEELPRFLVKGLHSYIENQRGIPEAFQKNEELQLNLTEPFYDMVLPYQLDGIRFIVRHGGRGLIADEMGCGKTCQAIGVMMHYRQLWPALIIVPSELLASQWSSEIQKFMGDLIHSDEIHIVKSGKLAVNKGKLCLISYSMLDRTLAKNSRYFQNFHVVVADEAHSLKNPNSKQSLNAVPLLKKAKVAVCITGTPQPNRPVELYPMCNALLPNVFSSYDGFTARYCNARPATFGYRGAGPTMDVRGASNEVELRTLLESLVMIRRLKDQVLDDLPVKERMQIFVEPDADRKEELSVARAEYDKLNRKASERGFNGSEAQRANAKQQRDIAANYLWALTGKSKIAGIKTEILRLLKDASPLKAKESPKKAKYKGFGQKIIVFAHHQDVMNSIDDLLCDEDVKFVRIDGTTTMSRRTQLVTQFQEDDDTELALLSIKVCGTGMNLSRANVAIFAELDWAPGQIFQAEDRIHRLGQRSKTVKLLYILTKGGSDEFMWDILQRKVAIMESTIGVAADQRADNGKFGASERGNDADGKALIMQRSMDAFVTRSVKSDLQSSSRSPDRGIAGKEVQLLKASEPNWVYNTFQSVNNLSHDKMQPKPVVESGSTPRSLSPSTLSRIEANKLAARKRREQKLQSEKQPLTAVSGSSTIQGLDRAFLGAPNVATLPQAAHNAPVCPSTLRDVALRQEGRATSRSAD
eukprot:GSChrysophyteH1.ASY1.ANO1.676.1 assembled CDS